MLSPSRLKLSLLYCRGKIIFLKGKYSIILLKKALKIFILCILYLVILSYLILSYELVNHDKVKT